MKFLKYLFLLILILFIVGAIYVAIQPSDFEVKRTRTIQAPAAVIYNNVGDFKNWEAWSSWAEADPDLRITLSEKTSGVGGSYQWEDKDGIGTMTTKQMNAPESIQQEMQFADFPPSQIDWNFKPNEDGSTEVSWTISGKDLPFGFKAFSAFSGGMEKQIGPHFERGLEKLDSIVVADMKKYAVVTDGLTDYGGGYYLYTTAAVRQQDMSSKMAELFPKITGFMKANNIQMAGMPFTLYNEWDEEAGTTIMSTSIPVKERVIVPAESEVLCGFIEPGSYFKTTLTGNYSNLYEAWTKAGEAMKAQNLEQDADKAPFEVYKNDPTGFPNPADWITEIYIPVKPSE